MTKEQFYTYQQQTGRHTARASKADFCPNKLLQIPELSDSITVYTKKKKSRRSTRKTKEAFAHEGKNHRINAPCTAAFRQPAHVGAGGDLGHQQRRHHRKRRERRADGHPGRRSRCGGQRSRH